MMAGAVPTVAPRAMPWNPWENRPFIQILDDVIVFIDSRRRSEPAMLPASMKRIVSRGDLCGPLPSNPVPA